MGIGTANGLVTGGGALTTRHGAWTFGIGGAREVRDLGDRQVISRVINSLSAQELGKDFGDYYLMNAASVTLTRTLGAQGSARLESGFEHVDPMVAEATWARGAYLRPNPNVDHGSWAVSRLTLARRSSSFSTAGEFTFKLEVEGGFSVRNDSNVNGAGQPLGDYARSYGELRWQAPLGATSVLLRAAGGYGTSQLPRHRAFVIGGRGSLLGEPFHGFAGSRMAWGALEWRVPVGIPEIKLGSFAGTGRSLTLAPNVSVGWVDGALPGMFVGPTGDPVVSAGLGASVFHDLLRFDVGYGFRSRQVGFAVDVSRAFWDIL